MRILPVISSFKNYNFSNINKIQTQGLINPQKDIFQKSSFHINVGAKDVNITKNNNITHISFKGGTFKNPESPAIQMKVRGVSFHQGEDLSGDKNVENLANSNWFDGKQLKYKLKKFGGHQSIMLIDKDYGEIGSVPRDITPVILPLIKKHGDECSFRISNIIAGVSSGAPTIGMRVSLTYDGNNKKTKENFQSAFSYLLNSKNPAVKDLVMQYQQNSTPEDVLKRIFDVAAEENGIEKVNSIKKAISTISDEIKNPENKNILLIGHTTPDMDTIGCVLSLQAAIEANYPDKNVICSIDDKLPSSAKIPGVENIKRPYNPELVEEYKNNIDNLKQQEQTQYVKKQISYYEQELDYLSNPKNFFDYGNQDGEQKFDLAVLMDIPTAQRFSPAYKKYIETAKNVIYIDHHPYRPDLWSNQKDKTGIDMYDVESKNMAFVVPSVPAACELVTVLTDEARLLGNTFKNESMAKQFVAANISGTSCDTGCFLRTSNLEAKDMEKPVGERPNFLPEGLSKWLIGKLDNNIGINKKWLRENIVYDISDDKNAIFDKTPRQKMIDCSLKSLKVFEDLGLGIISVSYDDLADIWKQAYEADGKANLLDVENSFKYSEVMNSLRNAPQKNTMDRITPYSSNYENEKIAVLIIQDEKEGCINPSSKIADSNGLRFSIRSADGTSYAALLAGLFNGGGHGAAAGGRINLPGIQIDSKLLYKLDGKIEYDFGKIYSALKENFEMKDNIDNKAALHTFEPVISSEGQTLPEIIKSVTTELRKDRSF